jgi:hypothetical protein
MGRLVRQDVSLVEPLYKVRVQCSTHCSKCKRLRQCSMLHSKTATQRLQQNTGATQKPLGKHEMLHVDSKHLLLVH